MTGTSFLWIFPCSVGLLTGGLMKESKLLGRLIWVGVFAVAFAIVEAAVVVYLRGLYYPLGFAFPLKVMETHDILVEIVREGATMIMLVSVGVLAGRSRWQRTGFFLVAFALWDIFYYVWLKVFLNWPTSILEWDVLFLIPVPWIGPVLVPVLISVVLVLGGIALVLHERQPGSFRLRPVNGMILLVATAIILYTFTSDTASTLHGAMPQSYNYALCTVGIVGYAIVLVRLWRQVLKTSFDSHQQQEGHTT